MSDASTESPLSLSLVAAKRCLYIAVPPNAARFKVGTALHPRKRWRALGLKQLDMNRTAVLEGPAWAIDEMERWFHFELNLWHRPLEEVSAGYSEWFDISGLEAAMAALERVQVTHQHLSLRLVPLAELEQPSVAMSAEKKLLAKEVKARRKAEKLAKMRKELEDDVDVTWDILGRWEQLARYALHRADGVTVNDSGNLVVAFNGLSGEDADELNGRIARADLRYELDGSSFAFHLGSSVSAEGARLLLQARRPENFIKRLNYLAELHSSPSARKAADALNAFYDRFHRAIATMPPVEHMAPERSIGQRMWEEERKQAG